MKSDLPKYKNPSAIVILILAILNILLGWKILTIGAALAIISVFVGNMRKQVWEISKNRSRNSTSLFLEIGYMRRSA